jgi:hypothetical protein
MPQNLNFSIKKTQFWLIPVLVFAGLFSWANLQAGGQSQANPVKTELVVSVLKSKGAKRLWYTTVKQFTPAITGSPEVYTASTTQIRWGNQLEIFSQIKSTIAFATCFYWKPRSLTSISLG